jgi:hypothetical protein
MLEYLRHPEPSDKGLAAHYKLWTGLTTTANVFDYTMGGFNGIPSGTDIAPAYPGFKLNGTDDFIDATAAGPSAVSTVAIWIEFASVAGITNLMTLNGTDGLTSVFNNVTKDGFAGGTTVIYVDAVATTLVTASWHLVAITDTLAKNATGIKLGAGASSFVEGVIGETFLYDRVQSPAEMKSLYELTKWRYPNNN